MSSHRYNVTFLRGYEVIVIIEGRRDVPDDEVTLADVGEKVLETERFLEKLTGCRVHIATVENTLAEA